MPTLDLNAPGATPIQIVRGLAAAGDVIRSSGLSPEFVQAGHLCVVECRAGKRRLGDDSWHWRAAAVFEAAQDAALRACFGDRAAPAGSALMIVDSKGPATFLD